MTSQYETAWEDYWRTLAEENDTAFWDVPADTELSKFLPQLKKAFDPKLPLIDFGCGNGMQTLFFAQHFPQVWGVDVSAAAVEQARAQVQGSQPILEVLDATDLLQTQALAKKIGEAHIFIRGVLHQIQAEDRPLVIASLQQLLGDNGQLFLIELSPRAKQLFDGLIEKLGAPPPQLARVFRHGIAPAAIAPEDIRSSFPKDRYEILDQGETSMNTNTILPNGESVQVPAFFMRVQRNNLS